MRKVALTDKVLPKAAASKVEIVLTLTAAHATEMADPTRRYCRTEIEDPISAAPNVLMQYPALTQLIADKAAPCTTDPVTDR